MSYNIGLPSSSQIFGSGQLKSFKQYGSKCALSDVAIITGGYMSNNIFINNGNSLMDRTCWYWTSTPDNSGDARAVYNTGNKF